MIDQLETPVKRWFSDGATMHYLTPQRSLYWFINLVLFLLLTMFDRRIRTGSWFQIDVQYSSSELIPSLLSPLNIFEYPSQILLVGMLMALICTIPILMALLYNIWHAIPFIMIVMIIGQNFFLGLSLLVSCAAVSFEPMRFKSKFVALVLWLLPEVIYWALFSGDNPEKDVLRWAVLYAPWAVAFINCVLIFGVVIALGHFLRYRPGVVMPIFGALLAATVVFFHITIGMDEYDFQANVYQNSPKQLPTLQSKNILALLEKECAERMSKEPYLNPDIVMDELRLQWRWAFSIGPNTSSEAANYATIYFYSVKYNAIDEIEKFIKSMPPQNKRVADALFYIAKLHDTKVDPRALRDEDTLRYSGLIPTEQSEPYWRQILETYSNADVSIEARWRLARLYANREPQEGESYNFEHSIELLRDAHQRLTALLAQRHLEEQKEPFASKWLGPLFMLPSPTVSRDDLNYLKKRIGKDLLLLDKENRSGHLQHEQRLAEFIGLDTRQLDYEQRLKALSMNSPQPDPLIDNIELAQILLIADRDERILRLTDLAKRFEDHDGGIEAMLELALMFLAERERTDNFSDQQELLAQSRDYLQKIIAQRPESYAAEIAKENLANNPIE